MDAMTDIGADADDSSTAAAAPCAAPVHAVKRGRGPSTGQQLNALLGQLTAVVIGTDAAAAALSAHNADIVDQMFALLLRKVGGPQTAAEFGVLDAFATELSSDARPIAAHACFERLLQLQHQHYHQPPSSTSPPSTATNDTPPNLRRLRTAFNLDNVRHQLVERWHFRMLNDRRRNAAYQAAIAAAVARSDEGGARMRVLDIGTGTGLLAMYAHRAGAGHVYACDDSPLMAAIARQTFATCATHADGAAAPRPPPVLIERHSTELTAADLTSGDADPDDGRVDLLVTETLDAGVFGEGILQTLHHAHEHLLRPNSRVIPAGVQLYIAGFESRSVALEQVGMNGDFHEVVYMRGSRLRARHHGCDVMDVTDIGGDNDGGVDMADDDDNSADVRRRPSATNVSDDDPYDSESVNHIRDFRLITRTEPAFACDFHNPVDIMTALTGMREQTVRLEYTQVGHLDGFVVWFQLQLDKEHSLHTTPPNVQPHPPATADGAAASTNVRSDCWEQAVFKLNTRFANSQRLKSLLVTVGCADGRLRVRHFYGSATRTVLPVPSDTIRFINDAEYLTRLEYEFRRAMPMQLSALAPPAGATGDDSDDSGGNVLDLCAFPHIGFSLLKERRARRLYCAAATADLMQFVASANCLDPAQALRFVGELADVWRLPAAVRFDVILVAPVDAMGVLDAELVRAYGRLRRERLAVGGRMVPHRVEMWGQLVRSQWLRRVTRLTPEAPAQASHGGDECNGDELVKWGITAAMNRFATRQQLGLGYFEHECVSAAFRVAEVRWGDGNDEPTWAGKADADAEVEDEREEERYVLVRLSKEVPNRDLHGMLCFYKVWLTDESKEPISTRRYASHVRRMCYVLDTAEMMTTATTPTEEPGDASAATGSGDDGGVGSRMTNRAVVHVRQHGGQVECALYKRGQGGSGKTCTVDMICASK